MIEAAVKDFSVVALPCLGECEPFPFGATAERIDTIVQIDDVTIELLRLANLDGGEYDGWETPVENDHLR